MRLVTIACVLALTAGCAAGGTPDSAEELSRQAQMLVPESADVVEVRVGACVQIDGSPACARIFLTLNGDEDERADELVRTAEAAGWEVAERERRGGGTALELERSGYRGIAAVWTTPCPPGEADPACADEIQVIEDNN